MIKIKDKEIFIQQLQKEIKYLLRHMPKHDGKNKLSQDFINGWKAAILTISSDDILNSLIKFSCE